jgi:prepilin-type N-terminal cleavage/methylation domain-containing protein
MKSIRGFTMLEIALSLSILGIMFGMSVPLYNIFMVRNNLDVATMTLVQDLRRAQTLSQVAYGDSQWGVHVGVGSILIYKGINYASRDVTFDEETSMPTSIIVSGLDNIMFAKQTGIPQSVGTTTLTSYTNETRNITINQKGMVDY